MEMDLLVERSSPVKWGVLIIAITAVAAVLRAYGMADWPVHGDEYYSIWRAKLFFDDFEHFKPKAFPAYHIIVAVLFKLTGSTSALVARLPSVIFGVATIPLFWLFGRRIFGRQVVAVAVAIIVVTEWHIFHSWQARYYSAVFMLSGLSGLLFYGAIWYNRPWRAVAALILGGIATAFHPTGSFVIAGSVCYLVVLGIFRPLRPAHSIKKVALCYLVPVAVACLPVAWKFIDILGRWSGKGLHWNYSPMHMALGVVRGIGLTVSLAAFAGALICSLRKSRLVVFLLCWFVPVTAGLVVLSPFADVRPDYVFAVVPACMFLAAMFCVAPFAHQRAGARRGVCIVLLALVVVCSQIPSTLSRYTERKAYDPRIVAAFVKPLALQDDEFVAWMSGIDDYLGRTTYRMGEKGELYAASTDWDAELGEVELAPHRTWFILAIQRAGLPPKLDQWLCAHAQLVKRWRAKRFDYLTKDIEVWLYDPKWADREIERPEPMSGTGVE